MFFSVSLLNTFMHFVIIGL